MAKGKILQINDLPAPKQQEATKELANSPNSIGVYSPEDFKVKFAGAVVTVKRGFNQYAPAFAVWLVQKYGPESLYGKTYRSEQREVKGVMKWVEVENPVLLDYDPTVEAKEPEPKPENKFEPKFKQGR